MRVLILRLRALKLRLHWLTTGLSVATRVADLFALGWLVTLLNAAILALLLMIVSIDLVLRFLVRQLRNAWQVVLPRALDAMDLLRQLLRLHLIITILMLSNIEKNSGFQPYLDVSINTKRGFIC